MTRQPGCHRVRRSAILLGAAAMVVLPSVASAQPPVPIQRAAVMAAAGVPGAVPIGDPWWDEAAPAVRPAAELAAEEAADPKGQARQQAEARLTGVRRSRGLQLLKRELSLVRASCPSVTLAAREMILAAGLVTVESQAAGRTPLANGIEPELGRVLEQAAGPEAAMAYRRELDARAARRQAAAIAVFVAAIDAKAALTADQRHAVTAALRRAWRPEWEAVAVTTMRQRVARDRLPDGVVEAAAAALDEETFAAWRKRAGEAGP